MWQLLCFSETIMFSFNAKGKEVTFQLVLTTAPVNVLKGWA